MKRYQSICLIGTLALSLGAARTIQTTHAGSHRAAAMAMAGNSTWEVTTGEGSDGATVNLFLPEVVHIYAGDTVRWHVQGNIEQHDIIFGPLATIQRLAAQLFMPVPQKAGPPLLALNPQLAGPTPQTTYDGSALVHSALLTDGQTYSLTFTKPGTYHYYCLIHFPFMSGTVVVSPRPATRQDTIMAGYHDRGVGPSADQFYDANFGPTELTVHAGDKVTWVLNTAVPHTISFGPKALLAQLAAQQVVPVKGADGRTVLALNPQIVAPSGGPTYDGAGFHSSGLLFPHPGQTLTYTVTFTKPGDYSYRCLIHKGMDGTIHVLPTGSR
jgi:plastocyanin